MVKRNGEFLLISKWKILESKLIEIQTNGTSHSIACRFKIARGKRELIIYNVHLPSPRPSLTRLYNSKIIKNLRHGDFREFCHAFSLYKKHLAERVRVVEALKNKLAQEKNPFFAIGDFNFPSHGYLYRLFSEQLGDAFRKRGKGFGWTFPGNLGNNFLGLMGPWMRLDYIFYSQDFEPTYFRIEHEKNQIGFSQHLPIIGKFKLN